MKNKPSTYDAVRNHMLPGDIIAFSGKGRFSRIVKLATHCNVSHVGIVCETQVTGYDQFTIEIMEAVNEATDPDTALPITGVVRTRLSTKLRYYNGAAWWMPLSDMARQQFNTAASMRFLMSVIGRPYDMPQAIQSGLDLLDRTEVLTYAVEDYSEFFCSELCAAGLRAGGLIQYSNPSEMTPIDLCRLPIYSGIYFQLLGSTTEPIKL